MSFFYIGSFGYAGGGKQQALVDLWATSRFSGVPAENQTPPAGSADSIQITTSATYGNPGAYAVPVAIARDYYQRIQYGGNTYWGAVPAGALMGQSPNSFTVNRQTANYTLQLSDAGNIVEMNTTGSNTLTVPPDSSVDWPANTILEVSQVNSGVTTITPGAGVTINSVGGDVMSQWLTVSLRYRGSSTWLLTGGTT